VHAEIVGAGIAAAIAKEAGDGIYAADLQRLSEHVFLGRRL